MRHEIGYSYKDQNDMEFHVILKQIELHKEAIKQQQKQNDLENKRMEKQMQSMQNNNQYKDI